jgi:N-acetylneuraminic acid mutarotase
VNGLLQMAPHTLGASAASGALVVECEVAQGRWIIRWPDAAGRLVRAEYPFVAVGAGPGGAGTGAGAAPPPNVLAVAAYAGAQAALRSGRRVPGQPPRFPSAALVLSMAGPEGWEDKGWVDEPFDAEIGAVALAGAPGRWLIAYLVRGDRCGWCCRVAAAAAGAAAPAAQSWRRLPDYPQLPGMAGAMTGVHRSVLIAAGGANFPGSPPWEGGIKRYYGQIFTLEPGEDQWRPAGFLPEPRAYGAVVNTPQGLLILGGEDSQGLRADSLLLTWDGATVSIAPGPSLPEPITSASAALLGEDVYLAGGYQGNAPRLSRRDFWRLAWGRPGAEWERREPWPGPARALAVAAELEGAFYLVSGLEIAPGADPAANAVYLRDAYRYRPKSGWERLPDLPWSAVAAPSPAPVTTTPPRLFLLGGVDGQQVGRIPRDSALPNDILVFEPARNAWKLWPEPWPTPVVSLPAVPLAGGWAIVSGELKPGQRTPQAWSWHP